MASIHDKYLEIAGQLPGYEPRAVQSQMVAGVYDALKSAQTLVVEAGTGAGKSFGYLIPALISHHRPIVVSTGTIALQEQLMEKDIPFVARAARMDDLKIKLVKGRRNYLCIQKMQEFEKTVKHESSEWLYVSAMKSALESGWDGDKATLDIEVPYDIWEEVQSDSEDCLGNRCGYYKENPYRLAREDLVDADVLVVNHALYLQDLVYNQAILPPHDMVIFDEAHHLKGYALKSFTARIGKFATQKLIRKIHRRLEPVPEMYQNAIFDVESRVMQWLFRLDKHSFKIYPDSEWLQLIQLQMNVLTDLREWLNAVDVRQLQCITSELDQDRAQVQRQKLMDQLEGLIERWAFFLQDSNIDRVNWAEVNFDRLYYEIRSTPLNIAEQFKATLWKDKTGILTSATLATNRDLGFLRKELGLPLDKNDLILDSPFNYEEQCELYLPENLPDPNDPMYHAAVSDEVIKILHHSQGRAFVLFTSYQAMARVSANVIPKVPFPCKLQGDMPKNRLIEWFKNTPNSVLFATSTYWEGIDVPGEALSCVIMDRIPFSTPDEPVHSAMIDRLKVMGDDWFNGYVLPEATLRLKQGFGRLIRSGRDKGIVAILDPRLKSKGYGRKIIRSLPASRTIHKLEDSTTLTASLSTSRPLACDMQDA